MAWLLYVFFLVILLLIIFKIYLVIICGRYEIKQSLKGKVILITGGTAGIGKETVRELAKNEATVHVLARNLHKAEKVIGEIKESTGNNDIHIHHVDLSDFSTVRSFAKNFLSTGSPIHILINNAGLVSPDKKYTVDGNEVTIQSNHLSHFLLTHLLLDRIIQSGPGRIINVSSEGHTMYNDIFDLYDINYNKENRKWSGMMAYGHSKLMNVLFTRQLAHMLYGKGVTVNSVHPGFVSTEILSGISWTNPFAIFLRMSLIFAKTEREGAATTLYLVDSDKVAHVTGQYFFDCKLGRISLAAADDQLANVLWEESEKLTGLKKTQ